MNYEEFKEKIVLGLQKPLHKAKLKVSVIYKNNSTSYDTIMIYSSNNELKISPSIRLRPYYNDFIDSDGKESIENVLQNIIDQYHNTQGCKKDNVLYDKVRDFNAIKDWITCQMVNRLMNQTLLDTIPYTNYLDEFAIIYDIMNMQSGDEDESIRITNSLMDYWNITLDELHEIGLQNTIRYFSVVSIRLDDLISNMTRWTMPKQDTKGNIRYVLFNNQEANGATVLLYPDTLKEFICLHHIKEKYLIILPSSIHEVIVLPSNDLSMVDRFQQTVKKVNERVVAIEEVLSNKVLVYNSIEDSLSFAKKKSLTL